MSIISFIGSLSSARCAGKVSHGDDWTVDARLGKEHLVQTRDWPIARTWLGSSTIPNPCRAEGEGKALLDMGVRQFDRTVAHEHSVSMISIFWSSVGRHITGDRMMNLDRRPNPSLVNDNAGLLLLAL